MPSSPTPPRAVSKPKNETKKKWLKLTRKGLLLSSLVKVGKILSLRDSHKQDSQLFSTKKKNKKINMNFKHAKISIYY